MSKEVLGFDINFLKQVKNLMNETNIEELEIEEGEERYIRVSRRKPESAMPVYAPAPTMYAAPAVASAPVPSEAPKTAAAPVNNAAKYDNEEIYFKVKSPVIGTFYEAPSPDSPVFAKVGDRVSHDTTVCIVEAMKVMNEIKADIKGKIVEILKSNGSSVQSGEVIFIIEKA